tara:strand:- start:410 stop:583 length:174 start_codon:yes stop_codon:yes gene_type:complete
MASLAENDLHHLELAYMVLDTYKAGKRMNAAQLRLALGLLADFADECIERAKETPDE